MGCVVCLLCIFFLGLAVGFGGGEGGIKEGVGGISNGSGVYFVKNQHVY